MTGGTIHAGQPGGHRSDAEAQDSSSEGTLGGRVPRLVLSGASGLIGEAVRASLGDARYPILQLVRRPELAEPGRRVYWDPTRGLLEPQSLGSVDAVLHLGGAGVAERWTEARKQLIWESRVQSTKLLVQGLCRLEPRPRVLVCASAVGYYGDAGDRWLDESSPRGQGFLAELCQAWEAATKPAREAGIRVVNARIGIVLSPEGGALRKMLLPFKLGLGGPLGHGRQWISWIGLGDVVRALERCLQDPALSGPVNLVAPEPATSAELARALGRVLGRPHWLRAPSSMLKLALGSDMAAETVLSSSRVRPGRLEQVGFTWLQPELGPALSTLLSQAG